jgi:hypothetical protein
LGLVASPTVPCQAIREFLTCPCRTGECSGAPGGGKRGSFLLQYKAALLKDIDAAPHEATVTRVDAEQLAGATAGKVAELGAAVAVKSMGLPVLV